MWLDRFSGHSTPSGSPPRQGRAYSPAPQRRSSHLVPTPLPRRPGYSPRSSSLSLAFTPSTSTSSLPAAARILNGSALKQTLSPPVDIPDPLVVLQEVIGLPSHNVTVTGSSLEEGKDPEKAFEVEVDIGFGGLDLQAFAEARHDRNHDLQSIGQKIDVQTVDDYEREQSKLEDLHRSILGCDDVLKSVEASLTNFQTDLAVVSAEIETLQSRSKALKTMLENRKLVEKLLGPAVEDISISPAVVRKISEDAVGEDWVRALVHLERQSDTCQRKIKNHVAVKAVEDVKPLLSNLTNKAIERIRDYLVEQIKAFRSPNVDARVIQQQCLLKFKNIYAFLALHHPVLAEEIFQAYINTIRWYYLIHFSRYRQALEKLKLHLVDKSSLLGTESHGSKGPAVKTTAAPHDSFNIGRRIDPLTSLEHMAISSHLAEEDKSFHHLEVPFCNFNQVLVDNASSEYCFLTDFFSPYPMHHLSRKFNEIFEPTFTLGKSLTKHLIDTSVDAIGILLCVRLNQRFAFALQRRKIPAVDGYINGTSMLLWPRFQLVMDMHSESIRRANSMQSGRAGVSAFSLTGSDAIGLSIAPHYLTQRFGQFAYSILLLSSEAGDDEPVSSSLRRLRTDFEVFLTKFSNNIKDIRKRERFMLNNYSLIFTIISDTQGRLAEEQKEIAADISSRVALQFRHLDKIPRSQRKFLSLSGSDEAFVETMTKSGYSSGDFEVGPDMHELSVNKAHATAPILGESKKLNNTGIVPIMATGKRQIDEVEEGDSSPALKRPRTDDPLDRPSPPPGPWHEGDFYLKRFRLPELHANQVIHLPNAHLGDLIDPIHPLFSDLQQYDHLHPALRLASKFLDEPTLLPYWNGLIFSTYHYLPCTSQKFNAPCYCFLQQPGPLETNQLQLIRKAMLHAARTTRYEFEEGSSTGAWAICVRTPTPALQPFVGTGSIIRLSKAFLAILDPTTTLSTPQRLRTNFLLANTLAHEFAHAARNARVSPPDPPIEDFEPFFYDHRRAEVGHAWESVILGGRIFPFLNAFDSRFGMCIEKWPDLDEKYMVIRPNQAGSATIPLSRKPPKKWSTMYTIPMPFVQGLFTQDFWNKQVKVFGVTALRFEKTLGLRLRNWEWVGGDDGFPAGDSSRDRWPDDEGIVRPGQPVRLSPGLEDMYADDESDEEDGPMDVI